MSVKILCVFGKYQYGDPSRDIGIEYNSFIPALKSMGHEVFHFDSWLRGGYRNYQDLNLQLIRMAELVKPQIILTVQTDYEIWIETLEYLRQRLDIATVSWMTDDNWKYPKVSRYLGQHYDAVVTTYKSVLQRYQRDRISNVLLSQWAASSSCLRPPLPSCQCRYQVSFVGMKYGDRANFIKYLKKCGIKAECFGYGWPNGPVPASSIPIIIQESIISLNFAGGFHGRQKQIKARVFEVPGSGGFLLTEKAPDLEAFYLLDKEIAVFEKKNDLVEKINFYLANPSVRDAIAKAGYERTISQHIYECRLNDVINFTLQAHKKERLKYPDSDDRLLQAVLSYRDSRNLAVLKDVLIFILSALLGKKRSIRATRRFILWLNRSISGEKAFSTAGWTSRMFSHI